MKNVKGHLSLILSFMLFLSCFEVFAEKPKMFILPKVNVSNVETSGVDNAFKPFYYLKYYENVIKVYFKVPPINESVSSYYYKIEKKKLFNDSTQNWVPTNLPNFKVHNLTSGEYKIYIKYKTVSGQESEELRFQVNVGRPWWLTWWFWGASFISIFGLLYGRRRFLKFWIYEKQKHIMEIAELELRILQLQMNPHFIFNALNSIQSYVITHDALAANNYLSKFANLFRMFLDSSRSKYVSLQEEIKMLQLYVEMECLRFEDKFDYEIKVNSDVCKNFEIPTMILQPFIENAINHGLRYKKEKGYLLIHFYTKNNYLICKMVDNGIGRMASIEIQASSKKDYRSQGLKITTERLATYNKINDSNIAFYVNDYEEGQNENNSDVGTDVEVQFPMS